MDKGKTTIRPKASLFLLGILSICGFFVPLYLVLFVDSGFGNLEKLFNVLLLLYFIYYIKRMTFNNRIDVDNDGFFISTIALGSSQYSTYKSVYEIRRTNKQVHRYQISDVLNITLEYSKKFPHHYSFDKAVGKGDLLLVVTEINNQTIKYRVGIFNAKKINQVFSKYFPNKFTNITPLR